MALFGSKQFTFYTPTHDGKWTAQKMIDSEVQQWLEDATTSTARGVYLDMAENIMKLLDHPDNLATVRQHPGLVEKFAQIEGARQPLHQFVLEKTAPESIPGADDAYRARYAAAKAKSDAIQAKLTTTHVDVSVDDKGMLVVTQNGKQIGKLKPNEPIRDADAVSVSYGGDMVHIGNRPKSEAEMNRADAGGYTDRNPPAGSQTDRIKPRRREGAPDLRLHRGDEGGRDGR